MVAIFVSDNVGAGMGGVTAAPGRTRRAKYGHTILDEFGILRSERDFDPELLGWWAAAEKDLGASPVLRFRRHVEGKHLGPARDAVPVRASLEQGAQILGLAQSRSEHKNGHAPIVFDVTPKRF